MLQPALVLFLASLTVAAGSQTKAPAPVSTPTDRHVTAAFAAARAGGPLALHAFLERMPKGADLHMHLSGAVYAETFLKDAVEDQLCVDPIKLAFTKNAAIQKGAPPCPDGSVPAANVFKDQKLYDALVDAFSMRSFVPSAGVSAHDWFFATFGHFDGLGKQHTGEWLDEVATRAAAQNEQYLEIMLTPTYAHAVALGVQIGWPTPLRTITTAVSSVPDDAGGAEPAQLTSLRDKLLTGGLRDEVAIDRAELAEALATRNRMENCGGPSAAPACSVQIRFLFQIGRSALPQRVFAQTLLAFELASADPTVVGLNFVQPEDAYMAMSEYHRQMLMLDYLHSVYPAVHISLHAGELAPGLVPPAGLRFHIREAVDLGHAERIGHGVDVMYETDPARLLTQLADRHIMIEINLTSNDVILGVNPPDHPLPQYLAAHVPVALSTDDEGVSRIDLTREYTRAALEFGFTYLDLKRLARTSLEHAFLPGASLWARPDDFTRPAPTCAEQILGGDKPNVTCSDFLKQSSHAAQQWELERRFRVFESELPSLPSGPRHGTPFPPKSIQSIQK